jgi:hypothetical protein
MGTRPRNWRSQNQLPLFGDLPEVTRSASQLASQPRHTISQSSPGSTLPFTVTSALPATSTLGEYLGLLGRIALVLPFTPYLGQVNSAEMEILIFVLILQMIELCIPSMGALGQLFRHLMNLVGQLTWY